MPDPRFDFSTNANPLGPCPFVLSAVRAADLTRYPDPLYTQLRETLAAHHGVSSQRIVVGAGASELILRLIQRIDGSVRQLAPTFSEYARCARIAGRKVFSARTPAAFLRAQRPGPGMGFICWPNNPTGECWDLQFIDAAAALGPLVLDLAYAPLCGPQQAAAIEAAAARAYRLYSPNKAFGLTGIRAAYVITPRTDRRLALMAPSWVIGRDAQALLTASIHPSAHGWLEDSIAQFTRWRRQLAKALRQRELNVRESPATFLLAQVGDARRIAAELRKKGVRVRDAGSFGLRQWIRLSAQPPAAQRALLAALDQAI